MRGLGGSAGLSHCRELSHNVLDDISHHLIDHLPSYSPLHCAGADVEAARRLAALAIAVLGADLSGTDSLALALAFDFALAFTLAGADCGILGGVAFAFAGADMSVIGSLPFAFAGPSLSAIDNLARTFLGAGRSVVDGLAFAFVRADSGVIGSLVCVRGRGA